MSFHPRSRGTRSGLAIAVCAAALATHAQTRAPTPPNSGQLLQQVPQLPAEPPPSNLDLRIQPPQSESADSTKTFFVRVIEITGNTELPGALLHDVVASGEGRRLTLSDLDALADRVSDVYHRHGFPLATAYVPAQTIENGVARIAVAEARYGKVLLTNRSDVSDRVLNATLAALETGQPITQYTLERTLLLVQDISGVQPSSTLRPGDAVGTSDLLVDAAAQPRFTGDAGIDNFGDPYSGRVRGSANLSVNSPLGQGDLLDLSALSAGHGMNYGRLDYRYLLNGQGTTLAATVSGLDYHLGNDLSALQGHGSAFVGGVVLNQPLIRNTRGNLFGQIEYDYRRLNDNLDIIGLQNDRHTNSVTATLAGDEIDALGVSNARVGVTYGVLAADNFQTDFLDQLGADTAGHYVKLAVSLSRLQQITRADALYLGVSAQTSSRNLDTSEQFYLGGPDSVRGYDVGVLSGARGYLARFEYRHDASFASIPGLWQLAAFVDTGWVQQYKNPFVPGPNTGQLSDAGVSVQWNGPYRLLVSASVAVPFGRPPQLLGANANTSVHCWVQLRKAF